MPESITSWIHCWTSGESVAGGLSSAGYLLAENLETGDVKKEEEKKKRREGRY
jgi:hypothetical protein